MTRLATWLPIFLSLFSRLFSFLCRSPYVVLQVGPPILYTSPLPDTPVFAQENSLQLAVNANLVLLNVLA